MRHALVEVGLPLSPEAVLQLQGEAGRGIRTVCHGVGHGGESGGRWWGREEERLPRGRRRDQREATAECAAQVGPSDAEATSNGRDRDRERGGGGGGRRHTREAEWRLGVGAENKRASQWSQAVQSGLAKDTRRRRQVMCKGRIYKHIEYCFLLLYLSKWIKHAVSIASNNRVPFG